MRILLIGDLMKQFGLRFEGGHIASYSSREHALGAKDRMKVFPPTRFTTLLEREVGDWKESSS